MFSQTVLVALFAAITEARFGQEQGNGAIRDIASLTNVGTPGQPATLAGESIQFLLAAKDPCLKLIQADKILSALGPKALSAARGLVAAEQNFNQFTTTIPNICADPTLPKSSELRGVVPLVDPGVVGSDVENANAVISKMRPFEATGLSVAQVMVNQGFSNFTAFLPDGKTKPASALGGAGAAPSAGPANETGVGAAFDAGLAKEAGNGGPKGVEKGAAKDAGNGAAKDPAAGAEAGGAVSDNASNCSPPKKIPTDARAPSAASTPSAATGAKSDAEAATSTTSGAGTCTGSGQTLVCSSPALGAGKVSDPVTGTFDGFQRSTIAGLDFGLCVPTMKFELGLNGRAQTAGTFQAQDPLCNKGQQEALNPAIISNRIHDQMTNVCGANQAAKDAIAAAQVNIVALGTRDNTTAEAFNTALGFAGVNTNPDNAPKTGLVGHV